LSDRAFENIEQYTYLKGKIDYNDDWYRMTPKTIIEALRKKWNCN
jgi:hypothetical protein